MSTQVERLEQLLSRVQENRGKPREAGPATAGGRDGHAAPPVAVSNRAEVPRSAAASPLAQAIESAKPEPGEDGPAESITPEPPQVSRPIAQVVSKHLPSQDTTFGELLRRSLSLKPR